MSDLPEKLYVETWPEELDREDTIHYEQTGYGIDMRSGATSEVTVYVKESALDAAERRGKIAALEWVAQTLTLTRLDRDDLIRELARLRAEEGK